jgi:hypothetical protein
MAFRATYIRHLSGVSTLAGSILKKYSETEILNLSRSLDFSFLAGMPLTQ